LYYETRYTLTVVDPVGTCARN